MTKKKKTKKKNKKKKEKKRDNNDNGFVMSYSAVDILMKRCLPMIV